ncbi:MAG: ArsR family transcriptional regulator [Caulobacter sp.]|nr:ArsR family transcriptional regulator [Caulobacter sp.]
MDQRVFEALASEVRRRMLVELAPGELNAGDIAARFDISKPAISQHLTVLESAGLVTRRKKGQYVFYSLAAEILTGALDGLRDQVRAPAPIIAAPIAAIGVMPPPAPELAAPQPAKPGVPLGFRWEAWRTRGGP